MTIELQRWVNFLEIVNLISHTNNGEYLVLFHHKTRLMVNIQRSFYQHNSPTYIYILCRHKHTFFRRDSIIWHVRFQKYSVFREFSERFKARQLHISWIVPVRQLSDAYFLTLKFLVQIGRILIGRLRIDSRSSKMSRKEAVKTCFKILTTN